MSKERPSERHNSKELSPTPGILEVLRGEISEPLHTISQKQGPTYGQEVEVRIVRSGVGLWGLEDWKDNKEWSGIQNHMWLTGRYTLHFADQLIERGVEGVNRQTILDGNLDSHVGRRHWDEAGWYPDVVEDAQAKRNISNETLGLQLLQGKVPQNVFDLVAGLAHEIKGFDVDPSIYETWDYRLTIYVDHRTSFKYEPLNTRMGDFLLNFFFDKGKVTDELKDRVYVSMQDIIRRRKTDQIDLDEADMMAQELGASETSSRLSRLELMRLILQDADTERELEGIGIDPNAINDETVPMPAWEDKLRREYVGFARESLVAALYDHTVKRTNFQVVNFGMDDEELYRQYENDFLKSGWWTKYIKPYIDEAHHKFFDGWVHPLDAFFE